MFITYKVDGQDPQHWEWNPAKVRASEAELIEDRSGEAWEQFKMSLISGRMRSRRVLLWTLLRRDHPTLRLEDVDFSADEVEIEFSRQELEGIRDGIEKADSLPEEKRQVALKLISDQLTDAREGDSSGKARWNLGA